MKVLVTGATGFVGTKLVRAMTRDGHTVPVLTRNHSEVGSKIAATVTAFASNPQVERQPAAAHDGVQALFTLPDPGSANQR